MQLTTLKCPACGAVANIQGNESFFTCEYCQNRIAVMKPISVSSIVDGLNEIEQTKYSNFVSIFNQAMLAGNYKEAYEYCNKALEINPNSATIWENKAICTLWISTMENLLEKAGEIISYLNASKRIDENSFTYGETVKSIAENLFHSTRYKYNHVNMVRQPNNSFTYDYNGESELIACFKLFEMCFQIYPNVEYLEKSIKLLTTGNMWIVANNNSYISNRHQFDAVRKVLVLRKKVDEIKHKDPVNRKKEEKKMNNLEIGIEKNKIISKWVLIFFVIFFIIISTTAIIIKPPIIEKNNDDMLNYVILIVFISGGLGALVGSIVGNIKVKQFNRSAGKDKIVIK
jgi:hypothetical protein